MFWITALIALIADQATKIIVQNQAALHEVEIIPGFFHLTYAKNTGAAWSMFSGYPQILGIISAAAVIAMVWYVTTKKPEKLVTFAIGLMAGGAVGNLIDRMFLGYVRDFLNFYIFGYDFPIFNIADSALCIGVFLLLIVSLKEDES